MSLDQNKLKIAAGHIDSLSRRVDAFMSRRRSRSDNEFKESDHPRATDGKFGSGGGGGSGVNNGKKGKSEQGSPVGKVSDYIPVRRRPDDIAERDFERHHFQVTKQNFPGKTHISLSDMRNKYPTKEVSLKDVVGTQDFLSQDKVDKYQASSVKGKRGVAPLGVEYKGKVYIIDGTHRTIAAIRSGKEKIKIHVGTIPGDS